MDETTLKLPKVVEEKDDSVKELSKRLEGYYAVTRVLLEEISHNLVSSRTSTVGDNFDSHDIGIDKLVRRIDLLENNLNQYVNK